MGQPPPATAGHSLPSAPWPGAATHHALLGIGSPAPPQPPTCSLLAAACHEEGGPFRRCGREEQRQGRFHLARSRGIARHPPHALGALTGSPWLPVSGSPARLPCRWKARPKRAERYRSGGTCCRGATKPSRGTARPWARRCVVRPGLAFAAAFGGGRLRGMGHPPYRGFLPQRAKAARVTLSRNTKTVPGAPGLEGRHGAEAVRPAGAPRSGQWVLPAWQRSCCHMRKASCAYGPAPLKSPRAFLTALAFAGEERKVGELFAKENRISGRVGGNRNFRPVF